MNTRSSSSAKGKQPSNNSPHTLLVSSPDEELESNHDHDDEVLELRAQIQALQQAQVQQSVDTKASIDDIKRLLQQIYMIYNVKIS